MGWNLSNVFQEHGMFLCHWKTSFLFVTSQDEGAGAGTGTGRRTHPLEVAVFFLVIDGSSMIVLDFLLNF